MTGPWTLPDAHLVLPADAPRDEWLEGRRAGIGSSDIATLLGVNDYECEYELWLDKTGRAGPERHTEAMRRGTWLEPHLADYFAAETGLAVRRCGLLRSRYVDAMLATPDRLSADAGVVEIKSMGSYAKVREEWRDGGIARAAYVQGQHQLAVSGRSHVWFVAYEIDRPPLIVGPVDRDEQLIAYIRDRVEGWWAEHVKADVPPPVDLAAISDEEITLRWPTAVAGETVQAEWPTHVRALLEEREQLKADESKAKARAKEIDQALKVMVGDAEALLVGERPVLTLKNQRNNPVVSPDLEVDHPDIWDGYIRRGSSRRIHIVKGWEKAYE